LALPLPGFPDVSNPIVLYRLTVANVWPTLHDFEIDSMGVIDNHGERAQPGIEKRRPTVPLKRRL
jgi:hypothetical protein